MKKPVCELLSLLFRQREQRIHDYAHLSNHLFHLCLMLLLLVLHALLELSVLLLQSVNLVLHVLDPEIL